MHISLKNMARSYLKGLEIGNRWLLSRKDGSGTGIPLPLGKVRRKGFLSERIRLRCNWDGSAPLVKK
jgi:hypothetical protein